MSDFSDSFIIFKSYFGSAHALHSKFLYTVFDGGAFISN